MSKSLGNFFLVKDILEHYPPEVLRFFILATHYRSPLDFSDERLTEAGRSLDRLRNAVESLRGLETQSKGAASSEAGLLKAAAVKAENDFNAAMDDDFNSALAISVMFGLAKEINIYHGAVVSGKIPCDSEAVIQARDIYFGMADVLGILVNERSGKMDGADELVDQLMGIIIEIRQEARKKKDWATADKIRDSLSAINIIIEDSPQGARWKKR